MASKVLVVGSGAIGLRTALELLRRGSQVILRSPRHPLNTATCSMGAGGLWMPFHCDDPRTDSWALTTLDELWDMAEKPEETSADRPNYQALVEITPAIAFHREHKGPTVEDFALQGSALSTKLPSWSSDPRLRFQHLTVEMLSWQNVVHRIRLPPEQELIEAGYLHAWLFWTPIVNTPKMLEYLLAQVQSSPKADVNVETGLEYESIEHMVETAAELGCDTVVNCTGLGSAKLCHDRSMVGARGVLLHFDRKTCRHRLVVQETEFGPNHQDAVLMTDDVPWGTETLPCYIIPRGDRVLVGGSYLEGDTYDAFRPEDRQRLMVNARRLGLDTDLSQPVDEWTGFRPYRPTVRLEFDPAHFRSNGIRVIHSYGYGGSGWTVNVGAAKDCANMVLRNN